MRHLALPAIALLALAGCANAQEPAPVATGAPMPLAVPAPASDNGPLAKLSTFTMSDLQAASADAHANNDLTAYQCYDFLIKTIPTLPNFQPGQTVGAVLVFQKLRDLNNGLQSQQGALKSLNLACAPLVIDTQTVINRLLLIGSGTVATGGALAPLGALIP